MAVGRHAAQAANPTSRGVVSGDEPRGPAGGSAEPAVASARFEVKSRVGLAVPSAPPNAIVTALCNFAGTDPFDPNSLLRILSLADGNLLTWSSVSGKTYRVWSTADLPTSFAPISGVVTASGPTAAWLTPSPTDPATFYRINTLP